MEPIKSTEQFDQLLASNETAVVDFYTDWCVDCKRVEAGFTEFAGANQQRAAFAKLNAEEVREVAERFDVRGIPSILVFRNGDLVDRLYSRDAKTVKQVVDFTEKALQSAAAR